MFRFDIFEVDVRAIELRKAGRRVKLQEQPWQVLLALLDQAGEIVTRDQLRERLWPANTFVDFDHSLNIAINKIRDALDDAAANPRLIETVPKRGYRFVAPVERIVPEPHIQANRPTAPARRLAAISLLVAAATLLILGVASVVGRTPIASPPHRPVIAVLPLRNLSAEPDTEYFSDGLTDEIINNLSSIEGLEVKSRTSSFHFKCKDVGVSDVGKQLQADLVLEGTVARSAGRLRLDVDLVRVSDDLTLWSQRYNREMADVFRVQDEISQSIVNQLRLKGIGGQRRYSTNLKAYDTYLRAMSLSNENSPAEGLRLKRAIELFGQVTADDDRFAPAYAAAAEAWANLRNRGRSRESTERMREAAEKAIELDPLLPAARASLGLVHASDLRWQDAEADFRLALEVDPNSAGARSDFARFVLFLEGKTTEGLAQLRMALELDPLSPSRRLALAHGEMRVAAYGKAFALAESVLVGDPRNEVASQLMARALMVQGKSEEAVRILERLSPASHGYLGYAYAVIGRRRDAEAIAAEADVAAARHQVLIYTALGERERAFAALQELAQANDYAADWFPGDPELAPLRDDPRMREFRRQRGLAPIR